LIVSTAVTATVSLVERLGGQLVDQHALRELAALATPSGLAERL
jgi:hypothetical protein